LAVFHELAVQIGLDVLVEIHDEAELEVALNAKATLIGVNQRDLVTFQVDHERAVRMASVIPDDAVKVAESGVRGANDARSLRDAGYLAILVGETLVTSPDPAATIRQLRGTPTPQRQESSSP
jgi:indole-3-glycerol phosphate synthase